MGVAGSVFSVSYEVFNHGLKAAGREFGSDVTEPWTDALFRDGERVGTVRGRGPLPPGGSQTTRVAAINLGIPDHELHVLQLHVDVDDTVAEVR